jgi:hypothetical protein
MNDELRESLPVFDELESADSAWNVYQYMLKLSSATVGKIVLGIDFNHFTSMDAPLHKMPLAIAHSLALNKKITSMGEWYAHLPFGDPKRLRDLQAFMSNEINKVIQETKGNGTEDLPLQDAALKAANLVGMTVQLRISIHICNLVPLLTTSCRLLYSCGRQFRRTPPNREHVRGLDGRFWCRIHHYLISAVMAHLWTRHVSWNARAFGARIGES